MQLQAGLIFFLAASTSAAPAGSNNVLPSSSSSVATTVAGRQKSGNHSDLWDLERRAVFVNGCTKSDQRTVGAALRLCTRVALEAATAATRDAYNVELFFGYANAFFLCLLRR